MNKNNKREFIENTLINAVAGTALLLLVSNLVTNFWGTLAQLAGITVIFGVAAAIAKFQK